MEKYRELAGGFIGKRRERPLVCFEKEIATKYKNDIFVLSYLKRCGGYAHPKELSEEFLISTAQMAVILNQMEEKQLVMRLHDPVSSRQTIVQITERGEAFFDDINSRIVDFTARLFSKIGEEDSRSLIRILEKLGAALAEEDIPGEALHKTNHSERKTGKIHIKTQKQKAVQEGGSA